MLREIDGLYKILISFTTPSEAEQRWLNLKLKVELKLWKYLDAERPLICSDAKFDLPFKRYSQTFNKFFTKICLEQIFQEKRIISFDAIMITPTTWVKQASFHMEDCFYNFKLCMNIAGW